MKIKLLLLALNIFLVIGLIGLLYFSIHSNSVGITQVREKYTEVFFADHLNLPKVFKKNEGAHFAFVINNHEGKDMEYQYIVGLFENGTMTEISKDQIYIGRDGSKKIDVSVTVPSNFYQGQVRVQLINPSQTISFSITSLSDSNL